jgi:hypothetical protein
MVYDAILEYELCNKILTRKFAKLFNSFNLDLLDNSILSETYIKFLATCRVELDELNIDKRKYILI